jgi:ribosome biogenesis GTPase
VLLDDGRTVPALLRGRLFEDRDRDRNPVAVGDRVRLTLEGDDWAIDEVLPRRNAFGRRVAGEDHDLRQVLAANVDQVVVVNSVGLPPFSSIVADRIVASYADAEAPVLLTSAVDGTGLEELRATLAGRTSVLYGLSGVGKSTLMNALDPSLELETREVSASLSSGRHTTTFSRWYPFDGGGAVIDTPGVRKFRPFGIPPHELRLHFPEMRALGADCRYPACLHRGEPDCAVAAALEDGRLAPSRHRSYLELLEELEGTYGGTGSNEPKDGPDHKTRR